MAKWRPRGKSKASNKPKWTGTYQPFDGGAKDACYRTNDINNALYRDRRSKERIKVVEGDINATDLKTITINFHEKHMVPIAEDLGMWTDKHSYRLSCGHRTAIEEKKEIGQELYCKKCSADQILLAFEHEWTHIYFKSDLVLRTLFVDRLVTDLQQTYPQVPWDTGLGEGLKPFLHLTVNAFDDLRVNSLQEKVRPGSAARLWARWHKKLDGNRDIVETSFPHYLMAVFMGIPLQPDGPFASLQPILAYATDRVRYKGQANMLTVVRWALDHCMGTLLSQIAPQQPQQGDQSADQGSQTGAVRPNPGDGGHADPAGGQGDVSSDWQDPGPSGGQGEQQDGSAGADPGGTDPADAGGNPQQGSAIASAPSGAQLAPQMQSTDITQAFARLATGAEPVDESEAHPVASDEDVRDALKGDYSRFMIAALVKAFSDSQLDTDALDDALQPGVPDPDMAASIQQLQQASTAGVSADSLLTTNAKANLILIDVEPRDVHQHITLSTEQRESIARLRSHFYKVLGRQKAKRDESGSTIDLDSYIQFMVESGELTGGKGTTTTLDVFEEDHVSRGFYALGLVDMSGSMTSCFRLVGQAWEILKASLHFPFVEIDLFGFRGGENVPKHEATSGEVWLYRYSKQCNGYLGSSLVRGYGGPFRVPVDLGGITPMNSAIHVSVQHCLRQPAGMMKRLFILTDGSPLQTRINGKGLSSWLLRKFVQKEVRDGRSKGIGITTLIIGNSISDEEAVEMFGPPQFWRRAMPTGQDSVQRMLQLLVLSNFSRYLRSRG